jgi:AraC-like DNA-binding protein
LVIHTLASSWRSRLVRSALQSFSRFSGHARYRTDLLISRTAASAGSMALGNTPFDTIDVTLELLGAAFRAQRQPSRTAPRDRLFARISRYIEGLLQNADLSPKKIAEDNGISVRYLYQLFSLQGMTVAGWVRTRRLARCRADLDAASAYTSVTESTYKWGFNDSAHFSRLFKVSFGMSPTVYRSSRLGEPS